MTSRHWSTPAIDSERAYVDRVLSPVTTAEPATRLEIALTYVLDRSSDIPLARRFLFACAALELHAAHGGLTDLQAARVVDIARSILKIANIRPATSRLAYLYGELHERLSRVHARNGRHVEATWELHVAAHYGRDHAQDDAAPRLIRGAAADLRLGLPAAALARLELLRAPAASPEHLAAAAALAGRALWLAGRHDEAVAKLAPLAAGDAALADARWTLCLIEARRTRDFRPALRAAAADGLRGTPLELEAMLLRLALPADPADVKARTVRQFRDGLRDAEERVGPGTTLLLRFLQELHAAQAGDRPLDQRLREIQRLVVEAPTLDRLEAELLLECAVTRWLVAFNQMELAATMLERYRARCRGFSGGAAEDLFGLLDSLELRTILRRYAKGG